MSQNENSAPTTEQQLDPRFDLKQYEKGGQFENATVVDIAQAMAEAPNDEIRYKFAKLQLEKVKSQFIEPMKEIREKEKAEEQKKAEERAAAVAQFRERVNELFNDDILQSFAEIAADYGEAGHGNVLTVEIFAKKGEDGSFTAEITSNIAKPRAKRGESSRSRETGPTGAGVLVSGKAADGDKGKNLAGEHPSIDGQKAYSSFAEAARDLGYVDDNTNMKGLNCKRLLESKGFSTAYQEAPAKSETKEPVPQVRIRR